MVSPVIRCPTCEEWFDPAQSKSMPFCSERCQRIDLGRWLGERYSVPVTPKDDESGEVPEEER